MSSLLSLREQVADAIDEGWTPGEDGSEFYTSAAVNAVMLIPLIDAAPDLLAACRTALHELEWEHAPMGKAAEALRAAIAKFEQG